MEHACRAHIEVTADRRASGCAHAVGSQPSRKPALPRSRAETLLLWYPYEQENMVPRRFKTNHQFKLWFGINRSVIYHRKRQAFCESLDTWFDIALFLMGFGVVSLAMQDSSGLELLVGIAIVATTVLKLKLGLGQTAGTHKRLVYAFTRLQEELESTDDDEVIHRIYLERLALEEGEPPVMQVLNVICHNQLLVSIGRDDPKERVPVSWFQRFAANLFSFSKTRFAKGT